MWADDWVEHLVAQMVGELVDYLVDSMVKQTVEWWERMKVEHWVGKKEPQMGY